MDIIKAGVKCGCPDDEYLVLVQVVPNYLEYLVLVQVVPNYLGFKKDKLYYQCNWCGSVFTYLVPGE